MYFVCSLFKKCDGACSRSPSEWKTMTHSYSQNHGYWYLPYGNDLVIQGHSGPSMEKVNTDTNMEHRWSYSDFNKTHPMPPPITIHCYHNKRHFSTHLQINKPSLRDIRPTVKWGIALVISQIARIMGPTWDPPGSCRLQVGPMQTPRALLSGIIFTLLSLIAISLTQLPVWPAPDIYPVRHNKPKHGTDCIMVWNKFILPISPYH